LCDQKKVTKEKVTPRLALRAPSFLTAAGAPAKVYPYPSLEAPHLTHRDVGNAKGLPGAILAMRRPYGPNPVSVAVLGCVEGGYWCHI
jgi:hypothetical protein